MLNLLSNHTNTSNIHLTVAAVIEYNNKFLLVTDNTKNGFKLNQPAGHVEDGEGIIDAIIREVKEETNIDFIPKNLVGIYLCKLHPDHTYLRICFKGVISGNIDNPHPYSDDDGVIEAKWYTLDEVNQLSIQQLRSPLVKQCLDDYLKNIEFDLSIIHPYQDYCKTNG